MNRPIHIISANLHSVMNALYAHAVYLKKGKKTSIFDMAKELSQSAHDGLQEAIEAYALKHGMYVLHDMSKTNISVQIFDTSKIDLDSLSPELSIDRQYIETQQPVILVMDYAFGEQAYETMDELLKPYEEGGNKYPLLAQSVSVIGKAGILDGDKGDIMIPSAHIFEGTADNYPIDNQFELAPYDDIGKVFHGPMITVLGTSLQNKDILEYFKNSSWAVVGLEMEGAHLQKAIQAASMIRNSVRKDIKLSYAYYASDNPLVTGSTLASGSLGLAGVKPTYLITISMLNKILTGFKAKQLHKSETENIS